MKAWIYKTFVKIFGDCNGHADKYLHFLGSYFIYLVLFGLFVWIGIRFDASIMISAFATYGIGYISEKHDAIFDHADIHANVNGIMCGMLLTILIGVAIW